MYHNTGSDCDNLFVFILNFQLEKCYALCIELCRYAYYSSHNPPSKSINYLLTSMLDNAPPKEGSETLLSELQNCVALI